MSEAVAYRVNALPPENQANPAASAGGNLPDGKFYRALPRFTEGKTMIGSVGAFNAASFSAATSLSRNSSSAQDANNLANTNQAPSAADIFKNYMKMSPAERMEDTWLKSHGLTKEKLAAMSPTEREAVMKQMKDEIEQDLKLKTEQKGQQVDVLA